MSETWKSVQAQKVVNNKNIPEWAEGLYYSSGLIKEDMTLGEALARLEEAEDQ